MKLEHRENFVCILFFKRSLKFDILIIFRHNIINTDREIVTGISYKNRTPNYENNDWSRYNLDRGVKSEQENVFNNEDTRQNIINSLNNSFVIEWSHP